MRVVMVRIFSVCACEHVRDCVRDCVRESVSLSRSLSAADCDWTEREGRSERDEIDWD